MFLMPRFSCTYLIEAHAAQLVQAGGKQEWLDQGLAAAPVKVLLVVVKMVIVVGNTGLWPILVDHTYNLQIQKLYDLNKILAHRPWSLTPNHIEELTKYSSSSLLPPSPPHPSSPPLSHQPDHWHQCKSRIELFRPGPDNWSLSELVYAIVLMVRTRFYNKMTFDFESFNHNENWFWLLCTLILLDNEVLNKRSFWKLRVLNNNNLKVHFHAFSSFIQCCVLMEGDEVPPDDTGLYKFVVKRTVYFCVYMFLYSSGLQKIWSAGQQLMTIFFFNFWDSFGFNGL